MKCGAIKYDDKLLDKKEEEAKVLTLFFGLILNSNLYKAYHCVYPGFGTNKDLKYF